MLQNISNPDKLKTNHVFLHCVWYIYFVVQCGASINRNALQKCRSLPQLSFINSKKTHNI